MILARCVQLTLAGLAVLAAAGCATSYPERYFALAAIAPVSSSAPAAAARNLHVAIDPVSVPQLADRAEMVFEGAGGQVLISDENQWAEPLKVGIARVVAQDLSVRLGAAHVTAPTDQFPGRPDIRVTLAVQQWQIRLGQAVAVNVLWTVRRVGEDGESKGPTREGRSIAVLPLEAGGVAAAVRAQNEAIARLSDALANSIDELGAS